MSETEAGPGFESLWSELRLLLDWQRGFGFYMILGDDHRASRRLRQRIEDATQLRTQKLQCVRPEKPEEAVEMVLRAAFPTGKAKHYQDWHAPLWIELTAGPGDPEWHMVRQHVLAALNRRRSALERDCTRPLLLQLPLAMAPEIVTWAPDLWSVRQYIAVLPSEAPPSNGETTPQALRDLSVNLQSLLAIEGKLGLAHQPADEAELARVQEILAKLEENKAT
jgi:hypothetical protein